MKKAMRKMIPAVIMLLISAMLVGTSTYAWFSMNKTVTVTGMTVKAKGSDNVMISVDNTEANFGYGINQTRSGNLEPASSANGVNFFYTPTANVLATGGARTVSYTAYSEAEVGTGNVVFTDTGKAAYDSAFNANYDIDTPTTDTVVYGYIDYSFYIKATNAKTDDQYLNMTTCNLLYNNAAINSAPENAAKAWRVALFAASTSSNGTTVTAVTDADTATVANRKTILGMTGAEYFSYNAGASVGAASSTSTKTAVTLGTAATINDGTTISAIAPGATAYYKVVVRLWLEGEDTTCKNDTFASLTKDWTLDIAFTLATATGGVTAIGSAATTTVTGEGNSRTAALNVTGETAATYAWYKVGNPSDAAAGGTNNAAAYTASESGTYYCVITTQKGSVYRTANVSITVS